MSHVNFLAAESTRLTLEAFFLKINPKDLFQCFDWFGAADAIAKEKKIVDMIVDVIGSKNPAAVKENIEHARRILKGLKDIYTLIKAVAQIIASGGLDLTAWYACVASGYDLGCIIYSYIVEREIQECKLAVAETVMSIQRQVSYVDHKQDRKCLNLIVLCSFEACYKKGMSDGEQCARFVKNQCERFISVTRDQNAKQVEQTTQSIISQIPGHLEAFEHTGDDFYENVRFDQAVGSSKSSVEPFLLKPGDEVKSDQKTNDLADKGIASIRMSNDGIWGLGSNCVTITRNNDVGSVWVRLVYPDGDTEQKWCPSLENNCHTYANEVVAFQVYNAVKAARVSC